MYEFHSDQKLYFQMQQMVCEEYIIPFIEKNHTIKTEAIILEIGCGTSGVLSAFLNRGHKGFGIDLDENSLNYARIQLKNHIKSNQLTLVYNDFFSVDFETEYPFKFDIIILKDVIEHIYEKEKLLRKIQSILSSSGVLFMGFPPWQMPFGGHQQICGNKILSHLPYFHLLPMPVYKFILKSSGESTNHLCELKKTGISIEKLEKITIKANYKIINKVFYLINPIYKYKFNIKPRKQILMIRSIPCLRNFVTTCAFYLFQTKN